MAASPAPGSLIVLKGPGRPRATAQVFPSPRSGEALQGSCGWFTTALEEAEIEGYTWHCNSHTAASRLVMAGVNLRTVAELLGHRTLQMVMRYSHLAPEHPASAVDRLVKAEDGRGTKADTGRILAAKAGTERSVSDSKQIV
jgi:integrase